MILGKFDGEGVDRSSVALQVRGRQNDVGNLQTISVGTGAAHQPCLGKGEIGEKLGGGKTRENIRNWRKF